MGPFLPWQTQLVLRDIILLQEKVAIRKIVISQIAIWDALARAVISLAGRYGQAQRLSVRALPSQQKEAAR